MNNSNNRNRNKIKEAGRTYELKENSGTNGTKISKTF